MPDAGARAAGPSVWILSSAALLKPDSDTAVNREEDDTQVFLEMMQETADAWSLRLLLLSGEAQLSIRYLWTRWASATPGWRGMIAPFAFVIHV